VLDEAQALIKDSDYFQSDTESTQSRPILRPIIKEWRSILPNLIVSGTGISMQEVGTVVGSAVAKDGGFLRPVTDIGGFDDEDDRLAYLKEYFRRAFWTNPREKRSCLGLDIGCVAGSVLMLLSDKRLLIEPIDIVLLQLTSLALSRLASSPPIEF
jgi:hypothetical protein